MSERKRADVSVDAITKPFAARPVREPFVQAEDHR